MTRSTRFMLLLAAALPLAGQTPARPARPAHREMRIHSRASGDDHIYESGARALDAGRWDDALKRFTEVASQKSPRADGALYWKAYAENRLGRRDDALATLAGLRRDYASSAWLKDAQALEQEIRQQAGRPVSPDAESNEDLKLMAINGLLHSDPDQALPLLEKLLRSANSPRIKERALFVLTQSKSPRARQLLSEIARVGANPDLQLHAVRYIGMTGSKESRDDLAGIYSSSSDVNLKRAILRSYMMSNSRDQILNAAKTEKNAELRLESIRLLGAVGGSSDGLLALYSGESDTNVRKEIAKSLFMQRNAKALVDLARKETNPERKKSLVQMLSMMRSKESTDYMMELLNK